MPGMTPPSAKPRKARATQRPVKDCTKAVQRETRPKQVTRKGIQKRGPMDLRIVLLGTSTLFDGSVSVRERSWAERRATHAM